MTVMAGPSGSMRTRTVREAALLMTGLPSVQPVRRQAGPVPVATDQPSKPFRRIGQFTKSPCAGSAPEWEVVEWFIIAGYYVAFLNPLGTSAGGFGFASVRVVARTEAFSLKVKLQSPFLAENRSCRRMVSSQTRAAKGWGLCRTGTATIHTSARDKI